MSHGPCGLCGGTTAPAGDCCAIVKVAPNDRKHKRESKHKIDSRFHSYPDLLVIAVLASEETDSLRLWCPVSLNFQSEYVYHLAMNWFHSMG